MFLTRPADRLYDALLTLTFPQACALCAKSVETRRLGSCCSDCWAATQIFDGNDALCWKCGANASGSSRPVAANQILCHRCDALLFESARACGFYEGALRESVLLLKRQPTLSAALIDLLVSAGTRPPLNAATRIVPVPLHPEREQRRGFNQAAIIARAIASKLNLVVDEQSLVRIVASEKYRAGLDSKGRHETVTDAFVVRFPQLIAQETLLLIDDVLTTGATASSCAAALLEAGAKSVLVLTIARPC
jgi:ComF family protein